jgi:hypothetical protein
MLKVAGPDVVLYAARSLSGIVTLPPQEPLVVNPAGRAGDPDDTIADARSAVSASRLNELSLICTPNTRDDAESAPCCTDSPPAVVNASAFVAFTAEGADKPAYETDPFALAPESPPPLLQPNMASDENRIDPIDNFEINLDMLLFPEKKTTQ